MIIMREQVRKRSEGFMKTWYLDLETKDLFQKVKTEKKKVSANEAHDLKAFCGLNDCAALFNFLLALI
jgi:hypothetical protein